MALGAAPKDVLKMVLHKGLALASLGVVIGLALGSVGWPRAGQPAVQGSSKRSAHPRWSFLAAGVSDNAGEATFAPAVRPENRSHGGVAL